MEPGTITVVVADDVEALRALVRIALEEQPDIVVVGEAPDGRAAVTMTRDLRPDVVLLDISMPGYDGLEALRDICQEMPDTSVVMLSGFAASRLGTQVLEAGARAYVEKGAPFDEIIAAVRSAAGSGCRR